MLMSDKHKTIHALLTNKSIINRKVSAYLFMQKFSTYRKIVSQLKRINKSNLQYPHKVQNLMRISIHQILLPKRIACMGNI